MASVCMSILRVYDTHTIKNSNNVKNCAGSSGNVSVSVCSVAAFSLIVILENALQEKTKRSQHYLTADMDPGGIKRTFFCETRFPLLATIGFRF